MIQIENRIITRKVERVPFNILPQGHKERNIETWLCITF